MKSCGIKSKIVVGLIAYCFLSASFASAQDKRLEATLERSHVSIGNPVYLSVTFYGAKSVPRPEFPLISGLQIKYVGPSTKISIVNGKISQSVTYNYLVISSREGSYEIGPFSVRHEGKTYRADAIAFDVSKVPTTTSQQVAPSKAKRWSVTQTVADESERPYVGDRVFLVMQAEKDKMYINEVIPVTIKLYVDNLRLTDIEYPEFPHEGFSAGKFEQPEKTIGVYRGKRYDVMVFKRDIFGIKEGEFVLGPARTTCKVIAKRQERRSSIFRSSIFSDDFFGLGYQAYPLELRSKEIPVTILPFPKKGRPADFQGAVGDFRMKVEAKPEKVKVGDPIVIRMTIGGEGNLDTVTVPKFDAGENFKTYEPQTTIKAGKKIYEQVIIPKTDEAKFIPEISFSFFDPVSEKYKTVRQDRIPIEVMEQPELESAVKFVSMPGEEKVFYPPEKLGEDIVHIKERTGRFAPEGRFLYKSRLFWGLEVIPLGIFLLFCGAYRKKEKIRTDKGYARLLRAPKKARNGMAESNSYLKNGDVGGFYDAIFRTLQEYLADRFNLPIGSITPQIVDEKFRPAGADENTLDMLQDVFSKCDMARFASGVSDKQEAEEVLEKVRRVIDYFEKSRL
jgi:hypothetical protein